MTPPTAKTNLLTIVGKCGPFGVDRKKTGQIYCPYCGEKEFVF